MNKESAISNHFISPKTVERFIHTESTNPTKQFTTDEHANILHLYNNHTHFRHDERNIYINGKCLIGRAKAGRLSRKYRGQMPWVACIRAPVKDFLKQLSLVSTATRITVTRWKSCVCTCLCLHECC